MNVCFSQYYIHSITLHINLCQSLCACSVLVRNTGYFTNFAWGIYYHIQNRSRLYKYGKAYSWNVNSKLHGINSLVPSYMSQVVSVSVTEWTDNWTMPFMWKKCKQMKQFWLHNISCVIGVSICEMSLVVNAGTKMVHNKMSS